MNWLSKARTLDFIIHEGLNICVDVMSDIALSEHSCVFFDSICAHKYSSRANHNMVYKPADPGLIIFSTTSAT